MPSTGPGSKPLSRSASCAARTLPWLCPLRAIELRDLRLPEELSPLSELPLEPIALLLPLYALGGMGGGDVKLVGALGAWLGPSVTFWLAMYAGVAGAGLALVVAAWHGYLRCACRNIWLLLTHWRVSGIRPFPELTLETSRGPRLAFAAPILAGTIAMLWLQ